MTETETIKFTCEKVGGERLKRLYIMHPNLLRKLEGIATYGNNMDASNNPYYDEMVKYEIKKEDVLNFKKALKMSKELKPKRDINVCELPSIHTKSIIA